MGIQDIQFDCTNTIQVKAKYYCGCVNNPEFVFSNPETVEKSEVVEKKKNYEFPTNFPQHQPVTDVSQLKNIKVEKVDSVAKKKETLIKLDTEEKPSRPIPTLKMKIDDN